jgi:DNA repair protein RadC
MSDVAETAAHLPAQHRMAHLPSHERPRERLANQGAEVLSDAELLAILLRTGTGKRGVLELARDVLAKFDNSLVELARAPIVDLRKVKGIGLAKACELKAATTLAQRLANRLAPERRRVSQPGEVADEMRELLRGKQQEELHILLLDTKNGLLRRELITMGLLDRSQVHAREVFRPAITYSAARLILVHNHPSGDPTPSAADVAVTRELVAAGKLIGIEVVDHLIMGDKSATRAQDYYSLREHGQC